MNMKRILIINGPNLNLLGNREKNFYGKTTLEKIKSLCEKQCKIYEIECDFFQSNHEGEIIEKIHSVDKGFDGIIIKLGKSFSHLSLLGQNMLIAGSSALDRNVSNFALENSLSGFEFLSCIPGTIGGGIRMNSGCYGEDISNIIVSVQVMDLEGRVKVIPSSDIKFSYRGCDLDNSLIFISATFKGKNDSNLNLSLIHI